MGGPAAWDRPQLILIFPNLWENRLYMYSVLPELRPRLRVGGPNKSGSLWMHINGAPVPLLIWIFCKFMGK